MGPVLATLRQRRPSLFASTILAILGVCLLLVGLDAWRTWQARGAEIAAHEIAAGNLARSLAQHAHDTVQAADMVLLGLRDRVESDGSGPGAIRRLRDVTRDDAANLPSVHDLFVFDASCAWEAIALQHPSPQVTCADRPYFARHRADPDRGLHLDGPFKGKTDGSWVITLSRRVDAPDGGFGGVVLATLSVESLARFYGSFDVGRDGSIALTSIAGTVLSRFPLDDSVVGRDLSRTTLFTDLLPHGASGSFAIASPIDGVTRMGAYRRVDGYPLLIVVANGLDEVLAPWRAEALRRLAASLALAAGVALLGARFAAQIRRRQAAEQRYRLLADHSGDAIVCAGLDRRWTYVSPAFLTLTGWGPEEVLGRDFTPLVCPEDRGVLDEIHAAFAGGAARTTSAFRCMRKDGSGIWVEAHIALVEGATKSQRQFVANLRDITDRRAAEERVATLNTELAAQARTDGLTGLANRRGFDETLDEEWRRATREGQPISLLMVDVDRFKLFNDRYGHPAGDACLREVARIVDSFARRPADLAARYGGEEMVVMLPGATAEGALERAEALRAAIEARAVPHAGGAPWGVVTASIGVATIRPLHDEHAAHATALVAAADAALYEAKRQGRNRICCAETMPRAATPPILADESQRLAVLAQYEDAAAAAAPSDVLDRVARLTAALFDVPIALVSLVGETRQCFVGRTGLDADGTPRDVSFCAHAIAGDGVFTVGDATKDPRFMDNPLVLGEPNIRFYAGAPLASRLASPLGHNLGALCIVDRKPRQPLTPAERTLLLDLAALAVSHMEQRRADSVRGASEIGTMHANA